MLIPQTPTVRPTPPVLERNLPESMPSGNGRTIDSILSALRADAAGSMGVYIDAAGTRSGYEHAWERLQQLAGVALNERRRAWQYLNTWRVHMRMMHRRDLPAPYVFANELGQIEIEWAVDGRELMIRLCPEVIEYSRADINSVPEIAEDGVMASSDVEGMLMWLLGA